MTSCRMQAAATLLVSIAFLTAPITTTAQSGSAAPEDSAEKRFKNIKVLTGVPASQLMPLMHFMRSSLGVRCEFCHVTEGNQYFLDDKKPKQTARRMIQMVLDINKNNFDGRTEITCNSCHRGKTRPIGFVPVGQGMFPDTTRDSAPPPPEPLPSVGQVLDRYVQSLGGEAALRGLKTRAMTGTLLRMRVDGAGTPRATAVNRGDSRPFEMYLAPPDKFRLTIDPQGNKLMQISDGNSGWLVTSSGSNPMTPSGIALFLDRNDPQFALKLRAKADTMSVLGKELVGEHKAWLLRSQAFDGRLQHLFFSVDTGLLLRRIVYTPLLLGLDPEQTDYEDYRDVNGIKVPFTIKVSYLDDNHLGTTRKLIDVRDNLTIEPDKFQPPPPAK